MAISKAGRGSVRRGNREESSYEPPHHNHHYYHQQQHHQQHHTKSSVADSSSSDNSFFDEFYGGVPFDAPCTLKALLRMDEPASPATLAANKLWLQSYHPEHFFKETDWVPPSSPESGGIAATGGDYLAAKNKLNPSSRNGKDSSGSSKTPRNAADSAVPSGGKENITSRSFHRRPADTEWGMGEENERWAQKRNEDEVVGRRPTKRRRAVGGVMKAPTSSSTARSGAVFETATVPNASQDTMQKRLQEYRQKNSTKSNNIGNSNKSSSIAAKGGGATGVAKNEARTTISRSSSSSSRSGPALAGGEGSVGKCRGSESLGGEKTAGTVMTIGSKAVPEAKARAIGSKSVPEARARAGKKTTRPGAARGPDAAFPTSGNDGGGTVSKNGGSVSKRSAVSRSTGSKEEGVSPNPVSKSAVTESAASRKTVPKSSVSKREGNTVQKPTATVSSEAGASSSNAATTMTTVIISKPVKTVKRRVAGVGGGGTRSSSRGARGASVGGGGGGREGATRVDCRSVSSSISSVTGGGNPQRNKSSGKSGGVSGGGAGERKRHAAPPQSVGGRRGAVAKKNDDAALSFDEELKARLAAHNKVVTKGKHTYEPAASVRDCRMWERKSGKKYSSLSVDERTDANKEIDAMRAAMKAAQQQ